MINDGTWLYDELVIRIYYQYQDLLTASRIYFHNLIQDIKDVNSVYMSIHFRCNICCMFITVIMIRACLPNLFSVRL